MSCPTCDHTMQCVGKADYIPQFWCPRCGTIKANVGRDTDRVPRLVERVTKLIERLDCYDEAYQLGVIDLICVDDVEFEHKRLRRIDGDHDGSQGAHDG